MAYEKQRWLQKPQTVFEMFHISCGYIPEECASRVVLVVIDTLITDALCTMSVVHTIAAPTHMEEPKTSAFVTIT